MSNYYLCDVAVDENLGRVRRFQSKAAAVEWAEQELLKPDTEGPAIVDVIHLRTGEVKTVARLEKRYTGTHN